MRILAFSALALGLGLTGAQLACSDSSDDCNATATCSSSGASNAGKSGDGSGAGSTSGGSPSTGGSQNVSGSNGAGGEAGGPGSECTGGVADDPTCWTTNELGVFVSSDAGDDTVGNGTKEAPFATISAGIAAANGKNVYVCLGTADFYLEKLTITDTAGDGVHIYGGFECAGWTYSKTRRAGVKSDEPTALRISDLQEGVTIENMRFVAADGTENDPSSFGAFVTNSNNVVLRRVEIQAGAGMKGKDGDAGTKGPDGADAGAPSVADKSLCGAPPEGKGGEWPDAFCGSRGGNGGDGGVEVDGSNGVSGTPLANVTPPNKVNRGLGATDNAEPGGDGTPGASGNTGSTGTAAAAMGTFSTNGFAPADGQDGTIGFPGQGGGGGGASKGKIGCRGASGGAGGMGGCGGTEGKAGVGGGASVGLLSWRSEVVLDGTKVTAGNGGAGGHGGIAGGGGAGAGGGLGGAEDVGNGLKAGGQGGKGGSGGNGGSGSGGTGGPSYALAYSDPKPAYTAPDTTLAPGAGGDPGVGGEVLDAKAPDGSVGDSAAEFHVP